MHTTGCDPAPCLPVHASAHSSLLHVEDKGPMASCSMHSHVSSLHLALHWHRVLKLQPAQVDLLSSDDLTWSPRMQGRIVAFNSEDGSHKIRYDDEAEEWLTLSKERFKWLAPRGASAGCLPEMQVCASAATLLLVTA